MAPLAMAQSVTGAVAGRANAGEQITVTNPATGLSRTVTVGKDGTYRVAQLPPGDYTLVAGSGEPLSISVSLGGTTTVNLAGAGAVNLDVVQVIGSRIVNRVDVRSTETATN
ncbi:MAG: carboxypeptidase-like regulatory domain-containing protein, partial [Pseudoxanthomonas sp.]